jgi:aspartyl-tRNA(Asn)/glutamyl-tRNA(Gln) amidotransferase subunit A
LSARSIARLASGVSARTLRARDLVEEALVRLERTEPAVHAFLHVSASARREADAIDAAPRGRPLEGVPIALKDNLCTRDMPTTCASRILEGFVPPFDATVVRRLRDAGAILIGKTNLDEFAMGSSTENSAFGPTRNPWNPALVPGGSSGGSAAAVACGVVPAALGSDTGGSIRLPAAFTATVGYKPTYGLVSRYGLVAYGSSLDQIGPIAATVEDAARVAEVIAGPDPSDSTHAPVRVPPLGEALGGGLGGLRFALPREFFDEGVRPDVRAAVDQAVRAVARAGGTLVEASLPTLRYGVAAYYIVAPSEASSNLARYDGVHYGRRAADPPGLTELYSRSRHEGFGAEVTRRILLGTFALSAGYYDAYYLKALRARRLIQEDFNRVFQSADVILGPTSPTPPFRIGEHADDPLAMYLGDIFTVPTNLAGLPAISIPCGFTADRVPIGLQLHAAAFRDDVLLRAAAGIERELGISPARAPI